MYSDNSYKDTPVPMPNTEVKLVNAESTWLEATWEDRKLLNRKSISYEVLFCCLYPPRSSCKVI